MTEVWRRLRWVLLVMGVLLVGAAGCGKTNGGGEGSETHWLNGCHGSADCVVGQCLCGVCTEPCATVDDCPSPLDICSASSTADGEACDTSICGSTQPGKIQSALAGEMRADACDDGRPTSLVLFKDRRGLEDVVSDGDRGFLILGQMFYLSKAIGVSPDGRTIRNWDSPSDLVPALSDATRLPDGSLLLGGTVEDFDGTHGWVGKVDQDWQLQWETELEDSPVAFRGLAALPDGGAVSLVGLLADKASDPMPGDLVWTRISGDGAVVWRQRATLAAPANGAALAVTSEQEPRVVIVASNASSFIIANLDGTYDTVALQTANTTLVAVATLPDGRLALAGTTEKYVHMTMAELDGTVIWERDYGSTADYGPVSRCYGFTFNAARGELTLAGSNELGGSWLLATNLDGDPTWQLNRKRSPTNIDGDVSTVAVDKGPVLSGLAAARDGTLLAPGLSGKGLVYFVVGAGSCR